MFEFRKAKKACAGCYSVGEEDGTPMFRVTNANKQPYCLLFTSVDLELFKGQGKNFYDICPYLSSFMIEAKEDIFEPSKYPNDTCITDPVLRRGCNWPAIFNQENKESK
jgi:hypothetical protein